MRRHWRDPNFGGFDYNTGVLHTARQKGRHAGIQTHDNSIYNSSLELHCKFDFLSANLPIDQDGLNVLLCKISINIRQTVAKIQRLFGFQNGSHPSME